MQNNSKIDLLTKENIAKDYVVLYNERMKSCIIKLAVFSVYYAFAIWLFSMFPFAIVADIISFTAFGVSGYVILGHYIKQIIMLVKNKKLISNGEFTIVTEKVVNTFKKERYNKFLVLGLFLNPVLVFYIIEQKPFRLVFGGFGEYAILNGKYYTSSQIYEMTEYGVYNRASVGDLHYLVVCEKNIAMIYNTKMFEYKEKI